MGPGKRGDARGLGAWLVVACSVAGAQVGCRDAPASRQMGPDGSSGSSATASEQSEAAIELLGGLREGDTLAGYQVTQIGAVDRNGVIRIRLQRGGVHMRLVVGAAADEPTPPVRTDKYALYYEQPQRKDAASEDDCRRVLEVIAKRIRAVEHQAPMPSGLRAVAPPSVPM